MKRKKAILIGIIFLALVVLPLTALAADNNIDRKMMLAGRLGDSWFVLSQGLAHYVNKQSDWLRMEVVATPGASAGIEIAMKDPAKYLFIAPWASMMINPSLERMNHYDQERLIGYCTSNAWVWITYDPEIKTAEDMVGKKVFIGRPGGSRTHFETLVLDALGIKDKVKILHGGYGGGRNALRDGLADVAVMMIDYVLPAGFKKSAFIEDLETRKPVYYIPLMPKELLQKLDMVPLKIYAGALDPKTQTDEIYAAVDAVYWAADASMDEKVVYELTRILYNNADKFGSWHAQGESLNKETVPSYVMGKQHMHPAALKFYEEQGVEVKSLADLLP